jgi:hypothetical protein
MVDNCENRIRIYKYKDTNLFNIYYDLDKDEFYVKKNEKTNYFTPIRWKHVSGKYKNKKMILINKKHIAIHFYNPETKQKKRITEKEWLNVKEEIIKYNKEEAKRQIALEEIWKHILEFIANLKTTKSLFYPDETEYNSENNSEN